MYQLIIVGTGPAGLAASIYASRYRIKHVVVGKEMGGLAATAHVIENWPGTKKTSGRDLMKSFRDHAKSLGGEILNDAVTEIKKDEKGYCVKTMGGKKIVGQALLLAMGTEHRQLKVPGEKEFLGKGVSYCAACDGFFFKNKTIAVVGGSDCAAISATFLADIGQKVYIIYRKNQLRCEPIWQERLNKNPKVVIINNVEIKEIKGKDKVESIVFDNGKELSVDGVFIEIGAEPNVAMLKSLGIKLDDKNHIIIDAGGATNVKGVFAAGDITTGSNKFRQVITAAAEGVIAMVSAAEYIKKQ